MRCEVWCVRCEVHGIPSKTPPLRTQNLLQSSIIYIHGRSRRKLLSIVALVPHQRASRTAIPVSRHKISAEKGFGWGKEFGVWGVEAYAASTEQRALRSEGQSHVTRHTSHVTHHMSHVTRHTASSPPVTCSDDIRWHKALPDSRPR